MAGGGIIGVQVLNEFTHVARRTLQWSWDQLDGALSVVEELLGRPGQRIGPLTIENPFRDLAGG